MSATFLRQVERDWLSRKTTGNTAQTPLGELQRKYWSQYIPNSSSSASLGDLESQWLNKYITTAGHTPGGQTNSSLWKQAVIAAGVVPSNFLNDNKIKFYVNAA